MSDSPVPPTDRGWRPAPSLVLLVPFGLALVASRAWPWPIGGEAVLRPVGFGLVAASIGGMYWATSRMDDAGTTDVAWREGARLVTDGPFRFSRNPAYLSFVVWCVGAALVIGTWWPIAILPAVLVVFHLVVIRPEEAYLERRFGAEYAAYRARVRRWL